jgi:hypothetical protein
MSTDRWNPIAKAIPHWTVLLFTLFVAVSSWFRLPEGGWDWRYAYAPAARIWWAPWTQGLPLMPWASIVLIPLAALPDRLATALVNGFGVIALSLVIRRLGGKDWYAIPVMLTPFGYWLTGIGQVDTLLFAALLLSGGLDVILLITKPQVAAGAIVARLKQQQTWRRRFLYLLPAAVLLLLSFVIWPNWISGVATLSAALVHASWNWAVWPWGLPLGAWLLWKAWRTGREPWGVLATPFLLPFVNAHTWLMAIAIVAILWPKIALAAWLLMLGAFGWFAAVTWTPAWVALAYSVAMVLIGAVVVVRLTPQITARLRARWPNSDTCIGPK